MTKLSYGEMFALIFNGKKPQIVYILFVTCISRCNQSCGTIVLTELPEREIDRSNVFD